MKNQKFCRACGELIEETSGEEVCDLCIDISKLGKNGFEKKETEAYDGKEVP